MQLTLPSLLKTRLIPQYQLHSSIVRRLILVLRQNADAFLGFSLRCGGGVELRVLDQTVLLQPGTDDFRVLVRQVRVEGRFGEGWEAGEEDCYFEIPLLFLAMFLLHDR